MATVVNLPKDTRAADLASGIGDFLVRMKDRRVDKLTQELMDRISQAKDEQEAVALFGDPYFKDVVGDEASFAQVITFMNETPLGSQSLVGYDEAGNKKIFDFQPGRETAAEAYARTGYTLERTRQWYAVDLDNPYQVPTPVKRAPTSAEVLADLPEDSPFRNLTLMDQEELAFYDQIRASHIASDERRLSRLLETAKFEFAQGQPLSPFARLIEDRNADRISDEFFQAAWEHMLFKGYGKTPLDLRDETKLELEKQGAGVANLSRNGVALMEMVHNRPELLSKIAGPAVRGLDNLAAEIRAGAAVVGLTTRPMDEYDFGSFSAASTSFKNALLALSLDWAASKGQTNRALSDKDWERFLTLVGDDISNPAAFIRNMHDLLGTTQGNFLDTYQALQGIDYYATGERKTFATFNLDSAERDKIYFEGLAEELDIDLPPHIRNDGANR